MKKLLSLIPALIVGFTLLAQPPEGDANTGMTFGQKTSADGAIAANELVAKLQSTKSVDVKVTGKVVEVCKAEGCWLRMETANGPMMIKMKDHAFLVPLAMNGKTIVVDGIATLKETSVEMLKHYAEDGGKTKAEIDAIKEPKKEITMQAKGILVL
jgi:FlaG/FlaF family flagellin (archaellin)